MTCRSLRAVFRVSIRGHLRRLMPEIMPDYRKKDPAELARTLTPEQFRVTQQSGTEPPFRNEFWDNHEDGLYVDIVSGEPLFTSLDKFDSGCGWPSFTKPVEPNVEEREDRTFGMR